MNWIKRRRQELHLSQQELADRIQLAGYNINWLIWFGVFPTIVALGSSSPGSIVYVPVVLLISLVGLVLTFVAWYLYWWLMAIGLTIGTTLLIVLLYTGAIEAVQFRNAFQAMLGG